MLFHCWSFPTNIGSCLMECNITGETEHAGPLVLTNTT